jgi:NADPH:quinone reductase-like Zn-dependent oxidoreductase
MKTVWFEEFGDASSTLIYGDKPEPVAGPGEVLVELSTSGVNPSDVKKRAGAFPDLLADGFVIPHSDGAGRIVAVGDGVTPGRVGERVWVYQAQYGRRFGSAAEYVAVEDRRAPPLPENTSFDVGACLGIPAMTAHRCVFGDGAISGQSILVTGGAGRVGYYAIQWARAAGARVFATASNDADRQLCLDMGAEKVFNHRQPDWGMEVQHTTEGAGIDRVVDVEFGANLPEILTCVRTGGTIATYSSTQVREPQLPFLQMMFMDLSLHMVLVYAMPERAKTEAIQAINLALERNELQHRIAGKFALQDSAQAHELVEQGNNGGCVLISCR